ncbi:MAG: YqbH/XkdH family protein [Ruminococcus sp.]|nr:YqbH/XkdH family protein [Ruminococcus sp.]
MALEDFFDHLCDIYHNVKDEVSPGYGLAASPSFSYPTEPDIEALSCHFGVKSQSVTVTQTAPANLLDAKIKLTLPAGTDVRINDKIVDCDTKYEYTAEQPRNIRGHHIFVYIKRTGGQQPL